MDETQAARLREPFEPHQIGKLPRAANKAAKDANKKGTCSECGKWHVLPAIHLDYVGHATVTDRLLKVDPEWTWEPMAVGPNGEPLLANGGLWIRLTVCGVTRIGFGDSEMGKGPKEAIGDAIRNAAMRFGVGLDLWAKEDLQAADEDSSSGREAAGRGTGPPAAAVAQPSRPDSSEREATPPLPASRSDFNPPNMAAEIVKLEVSFREKIIKLGVLAENESAMQAARASMNDVEYAAWLTKVNAAARKELEKVAA